MRLLTAAEVVPAVGAAVDHFNLCKGKKQMAIKINTAIVRSTASQISSVNNKMNNDFSAVDSAINALNRNWDGSASDIALRKFQSIKNNFYNNRFNVVNDMVNFMLKQVGEGYESTETTVSSAASAFK